MLSLCFNAFLIHGYLPSPMSDTILVPVVKNKGGDITDHNNYRPIVLASIVSKVFELILLHRCEQYLESSDSQFGFKAKHSTDLCVYTLKEVINHYRSHSSHVFLCFVDAKKAFDLIDHWTLFNKLIHRCVPLLRIVCVWYQTQRAQVRWGTSISESFPIENWVRQGGILSPKLFNFYIAALSTRLNSIPAGCKIGQLMVNHLAYADDLVLLCPSLKGLQGMVHECQIYGINNDITYNCTKTVCMSLLSRTFMISSKPSIVLYGKELNFVDKYKYLGFNMNKDCSDDSDINRQMRSFYIRSNYLVRSCSNYSVEVKSQLFSAYCSSMYCAALWPSPYNPLGPIMSQIHHSP